MICRQYWECDFERRREFIARCCEKCAVKRRRQRRVDTKERSAQYEYYLQSFDHEPEDGDGGKGIRVCKQFFADTLCLSKTAVSDALSSVGPHGVSLAPDQRNLVPHTSMSPETKAKIREHIQSFPTVMSHYCRSSTQRKYLSSDLSLSKMYRLFKEKHPEESVVQETYRQIFVGEFNLSFYKPKKDQCLTCRQYDMSKTSSAEDAEAYNTA